MNCQAQNRLAAISAEIVPSQAVNDFQKLLKSVAEKYSTKRALAAAIGIDQTRLNRALNKGDYPFSVLNCLRLAQVAGEPPSKILRLAGKGQIADLVEELYGAERPTVDPTEHKLLEMWRRLDNEAKQFVWFAMDFSLGADSKAAIPDRSAYGAVRWSKKGR